MAEKVEKKITVTSAKDIKGAKCVTKSQVKVDDKKK